MAQSPAEKQRRYRKKLKERRTTAPDRSLGLIGQSLSDYVRANKDRQETVDWVQQETGLDLQYLLDGSAAAQELEWTENLIAALLTGVETLSALLNEYKAAQVERAIDQAGKDGAPVEEVLRLAELRKALSKRFRRDFAEYDLKGR